MTKAQQEILQSISNSLRAAYDTAKTAIEEGDNASIILMIYAASELADKCERCKEIKCGASMTPEEMFRTSCCCEIYRESETEKPV